MGQHYDVIVIGGGHNGLVNAAYLAKAGKKVVVLERRHVLGGAAVTEEIFPGFLFSECSYVVSLLRPEIIRELDLPRHGLEILPLDGTFSPTPNGDYLWRVNDHAKSIRDIRRHSRLDAEAYDEFSKMMTPMCRFVKPMLSMVPPDPTTLNPKDLKQLHFLLQFEYYLKENAADVAARYLQAVEKAVEQLLEMPGMGAPKALKNSSLAGLRSWPVSGFEEIRVYYRIHQDTVRVIRVLHGRRDIKRILEKESHDVRQH